MSGRPVTSFPPSSDAEYPSDSTNESHAQESSFIPHVTDLVQFAHQAQQLSEFVLPARLLGPTAVDTATPIGEGASFSALRQTIPPSPEKTWETWLGGLQVISRQAAGAETRPAVVVFKTARIEFDDFGEPISRDRAAMKAVMRELFALVHPPLLKHDNIVTILGLAWGSNTYQPQFILPTVVLEYADCGTLASLQDSVDLTAKQRVSLCVDIAAGLDILHQCKIVHGDIKAENVLIFIHPSKKYLAKLGDFGFSEVGQTTSATVRLGGTQPWMAPEVSKAVPREALHLTDVYSYGLLVWRVATDNINPFTIVLDANNDRREFAGQIESLKKQDRLTVVSRVSQWYVNSFRKASRNFVKMKKPAAPGKVIEHLQALLEQSRQRTLDEDKLQSALRQIAEMCPSDTPAGQIADAILMQSLPRNSFYSKLDLIFQNSLKSDPQSRNLCAITNIWAGQDTNTATLPQDPNLVLRMDYMYHKLSWLQIRDLSPNVQSFLVQTFSARVAVKTPGFDQFMILAALYINGYGTKPDLLRASELLLKAARGKHALAAAYCYRICRALNDKFEADNELIELMYNTARMGSRTALLDIETIDPGRIPTLKDELRNIFCGCGAPFFTNPQLLHNMSFNGWMTILNDSKLVLGNGRSPESIRDFRVNRRGDGVLHLASSSGRLQAINTLLNFSPVFDINMRNKEGETSLLLACRAGQKEMVKLLLERGADASLSTPHGESPLHWLISFDDHDIEDIGSALVTGGGNVYQLTTGDIAYSLFPAGFETDFQRPGSPLSWAANYNRPVIVKFLMSRARDASIVLHRVLTNKRSTAPLELAAHLHHTECLEMMMDALLNGKFRVQSAKTIEAATHGADAFSMMLRHGPAYKRRLHETFHYLLRTTRNVQFATGIGGFGYSLLYYATTGAYDAVVEYLLSDEVKNALASEGWYNEVHDASRGHPNDMTGFYRPSDINLACGEEKRTPLLEAILWNRAHLCELLTSKGADIQAKARNPYVQNHMGWSALHVLGEGRTDDRCELAKWLVEQGVPVDRGIDEDLQTETPFMVAVQSNSFNLASTLLSLGADINALSQGFGWTAVDAPTTVLGLIVASAARNSAFRLRYLLFECPQSRNVDFIVEPRRKLTALHRAALGHLGVSSRSPDHIEPTKIQKVDYDLTSNREIMYELLQKFGEPDQVNQRSAVGGRTALHMAVESGNTGCVQLLLEHGADRSLTDDGGQSAQDLLQKLGDQLRL